MRGEKGKMVKASARCQIIHSRKRLLKEMKEKGISHPDEEMLSRYESGKMILPPPPEGTKPGKWRSQIRKRMKMRQRMQGSLDERTLYV